MRGGKGLGEESVTSRDGACRVLSPQSFRKKEMEEYGLDWTLALGHYQGMHFNVNVLMPSNCLCVKRHHQGKHFNVNVLMSYKCLM